MEEVLAAQPPKDKKGEDILIEPLMRSSLLVTIECDNEVSDDTLMSEMAKHGKLIQHKRLYHAFAPTIESGKRQIKIIPNGSILNFPHYIFLHARKTSLYYRGKGYHCKACGERKKYDHQQNCPNKEQYEKDIIDQREREYEAAKPDFQQSPPQVPPQVSPIVTGNEWEKVPSRNHNINDKKRKERTDSTSQIIGESESIGYSNTPTKKVIIDVADKELTPGEQKQIDMEKQRLDKGKQKERSNNQYVANRSKANLVKDMTSPAWKR